MVNSLKANFKHFKYLFIITFIIFIIYLCIFNYSLIYNSIFKALDLWLYKVFPSLLIFYLISSLLLSTKTINIIFCIFKPFRFLLRFETSNAFNLFLLSFFLGNPSIVSFINDFKSNLMITDRDADILSKTTSFINPLFIMSLFTDKTLGLLVYLSHIIPNILIVIWLTRNNSIYNNCPSNIQTKTYNINFFDYMNKFTIIILNIALYIVISYIIISILKLIPNLSYLTYFIEVSEGAINCSLSNIYLLPAILSFNGLCIHLQVKQGLKVIKYPSFLLFRLISSLISTIVFVIIY